MVAPHLGDEVVRHRDSFGALEVGRHLPARPMAQPRLGQWRVSGQRNNPRPYMVGHPRRSARTWQIRQPLDPETLVSVHPLVHRWLLRTRHSRNVGNRQSVRSPQHYLRTSGNRTVITIRAGQRIQRSPLRFRQLHTAIIAQQIGEFNYMTLGWIGGSPSMAWAALSHGSLLVHHDP